jgi:hypothetical protein
VEKKERKMMMSEKMRQTSWILQQIKHEADILILQQIKLEAGILDSATDKT